MVAPGLRSEARPGRSKRTSSARLELGGPTAPAAPAASTPIDPVGPRDPGNQRNRSAVRARERRSDRAATTMRGPTAERAEGRAPAGSVLHEGMHRNRSYRRVGQLRRPLWTTSARADRGPCQATLPPDALTTRGLSPQMARSRCISSVQPWARWANPTVCSQRSGASYGFIHTYGSANGRLRAWKPRRPHGESATEASLEGASCRRGERPRCCGGARGPGRQDASRRQDQHAVAVRAQWTGADCHRAAPVIAIRGTHTAPVRGGQGDPPRRGHGDRLTAAHVIDLWAANWIEEAGGPGTLPAAVPMGRRTDIEGLQPLVCLHSLNVPAREAARAVTWSRNTLRPHHQLLRGAGLRGAAPHGCGARDARTAARPAPAAWPISRARRRPPPRRVIFPPGGHHVPAQSVEPR